MSRQTVDGEARTLLNRIRAAIHELEPTAHVILYGSRARGEAPPDSDWDILILVDGPVDFQRRAAVSHRLFDLALETDAVISTIMRSKEEWASKLFRAMPWHENVTREGMVL